MPNTQEAKAAATGTLLQTNAIFAKRRTSLERVANARGIIFRLRERPAIGAKPQLDFQAEARNLFTCLALVFPDQTLINLKKMLPDS